MIEHVAALSLQQVGQQAGSATRDDKHNKLQHSTEWAAVLARLFRTHRMTIDRDHASARRGYHWTVNLVACQRAIRLCRQPCRRRVVHGKPSAPVWGAGAAVCSGVSPSSSTGACGIISGNGVGLNI